MKKAISFRLRTIDDDLIKAIQNIQSDVLSDLCRDGLRYMLGLNTTKQVIVQEKPLTRISPSQTTSQTSFTPNIFRPGVNIRKDTKRD